jgi:hypothetical protein
MPPVTAAAGAVTLPWNITDCRFLVVFLQPPAASVQPFLPDGFTAAGGRGLGSVGFEIHDCARGAGLNGTVERLAYGAMWGAVTPPDRLRDPSTGGQDYFKWAVLVPDAPRRGLLLAHGVPARDGAASVGPGPAPGSWAATMEMAGLGTFAVTGAGTPTSEGAANDLPFQEFTNATGGPAVWRATNTDWTSATTTVGQWQAPAGSVIARIMGATTGAAPFNAGHWSYRDGSIALPAASANP